MCPVPHARRFGGLLAIPDEDTNDGVSEEDTEGGEEQNLEPSTTAGRRSSIPNQAPRGRDVSWSQQHRHGPVESYRERMGLCGRFRQMPVMMVVSSIPGGVFPG